MVKTYLLAPNWTTAPPPEGPLHLGHILDDLTEFVPLNRDDIIPIDKENPQDVKSGFESTRSKLISGDLGFMARIFGLVGVGAGAGLHSNKDKNDVLSCKRLITRTFDPTDDYIDKSMKLPQVEKFVKLTKQKEPVYMVTGLKIGRGGSLQSTNSKDKGVKIEGGINPPGSPVAVEGKAGIQSTTTEGVSWKESSPFIVAFRVRKIWYHRGEIKDEANNARAVFQGGFLKPSETAAPLMVDDEIQLSDVTANTELMTEMDTEGGEEVRWIFPKLEEKEG